MQMKGKTVLVTGGSKGIGRAVVEAMARQGANVIINYGADEKSAEEAAKVAQNYPVEALIVKADITNQEQVDAMFANIKVRFSTLDVLVNNAGIFDQHDGPENLEAFDN